MAATVHRVARWAKQDAPYSLVVAPRPAGLSPSQWPLLRLSALSPEKRQCDFRCQAQLTARRTFFYQAMDKATHKLKSKLDAAVLNELGGKKLVGTDRFGNQYFEQPPPPDSYHRHIRSVYPPGGDLSKEADFDTNSLPSEWRQWLSGIRTDPPTEAESLKVAQDAERLQQKVAALDAAETKERLARAAGLGGVAAVGGSAAAPAAAFAQQVASAAAAAAAPTVSPQTADAAAPAATKKVKPFRPGDSTRQAVPSAPSGQGESFVPGAWVPPGS